MGILQYLTQTKEALSGGFNELKNTSGGILRFLGNNVNKFEQKKEDFYEPVPNKVRTRDVIREATELALPTPTNKAEYLQEMAFNAIPFGATTKSVRNVARETKPLVNKGFTGFKDLTTKFLDYSKGKTTLSKQEILDFANRPELKRGEADLLNRLGSDIKDAKIPAQEFADSIRRDLLELKPITLKEGRSRSPDEYRIGQASFKNISIDARQGTKTGKNYEEVVFESPITTNGSSHFPNSKNYFAHARGDEVVEGGKKIWREQEIQSDLLQKENLSKMIEESVGDLKVKYEGDDIWSVVDEQGKVLQEFGGQKPSGGRFGANEARRQAEKFIADNTKQITGFEQLQPFTNDRFGERIMRERIKEKAIKGYDKYRLPTGETIGKIEGFRGADDLTGKSNPQYRRYENWGKFLKNKYGAKLVTDPQGNTWYEIDLKPEYKKLPVEAFGLAGAGFGLSSIFNKDK